jgi:hypothetical protein
MTPGEMGIIEVRNEQTIIAEVSEYIASFLTNPDSADAIATDLVHRADNGDGILRIELPGRYTKAGNPVPFVIDAELLNENS